MEGRIREACVVPSFSKIEKFSSALGSLSFSFLFSYRSRLEISFALSSFRNAILSNRTRKNQHFCDGIVDAIPASKFLRSTKQPSLQSNFFN